MTTTTELRALIAAIEAGPVTRELEDQVLLAIGWRRFGTDDREWKMPDGFHLPQPGTRPSPLSNLQDATLVMSEGGHVTDDLDAELHASAATALTLASLNAELAKREAEDE